jgi:hypothetical protein
MSNNQEIIALIDALGVDLSYSFIPFSESRNKDSRHKSLNWVVTLTRHGDSVFSTEYSAGIYHCPSFKPGKLSVYDLEAIEIECERGRNAMNYAGRMVPSMALIVPKLLDVMYSLVMDYNVLDYNCFEDWADDYGYDSDSRNGESIYRAAVANSLKMRNSIGDSNMQDLIDAFEDHW